MMSPEIKEIAKALSLVQKEITGAKKDADNPFFKSKYADLESVWEACREQLTKNGLSIAQFVNGDCLVTLLMHGSGQWIKGEQKIYTKDNSPQAFGSAITYARRYGLAAIVGIVQVDDDANSANGNKTPPQFAPKASRVEQELQSKPMPPEEIPYADTPFPELDEPSDSPLASYPFPNAAKKYIGKTLGQVSKNELKDYARYMGEFLTRDGKPLKGQWLELINNIRAYTN